MDDRERRLQHLAEHLIEELELEDVSAADIDPEAPLFGEGLGLDSIDALELAVLVQRHYGIRIADMSEGKEAFASLVALDDYIQRRQAEGS